MTTFFRDGQWQFDCCNSYYKNRVWGLFGEQDTPAHFEPTNEARAESQARLGYALQEGGRQSQPTTNREPSSSLEWPRCEGGRQSQPITMDCFSATRLTPMQRQLMEMFVAPDSHRLSKHEICDVLWPKKDDANETLYALISRLKRELDKTSNYDIISDRGRAYVLKQRKSGS